jgi:enoyl-CoA hydratase
MNAIATEDKGNGILLATFNRPDRLNAINRELIKDFHALLDALDDPDSPVRVLILTGAGRAFCAGADLKSDIVRSVGVEDSMTSQMDLANIVLRLGDLRQPVIAAVNGPAMGAGFAFTMAADVRVAGRSAKFAAANSRIGLSAGESGMTWLLPRLIGLSRAFELLVSGRNFDGEEADRIGLLSRLTNDGEEVAAAMEIAERFAANPPFAVWMSKDLIRRNLEVASLKSGIAMEARTQLLCGRSEHFTEAVDAFLHKRAPDYSRSK